MLIKYNRLLFWNTKEILLSKSIVVYLLLLVSHGIGIRYFSGGDKNFLIYFLQGPSAGRIEFLNITFWLTNQIASLYVFLYFFYEIITPNITLEMIRIKSYAFWFFGKVYFIGFFALILVLLRISFYILFLGISFNLAVTLFVIEMANIWLIGGIIYGLYINLVPETINFGIITSFLMFIIFSGKIFHNTTNYLFGILSRTNIVIQDGVPIASSLICEFLLCILFITGSYKVSYSKGENYG